MGEIAEMMMEGVLCQTCGEYMDHAQAQQGYPVSCPGCIAAGDAPKDPPQARPQNEEGVSAKTLKNRRKRQRYRANKRRKEEAARRERRLAKQ